MCQKSRGKPAVLAASWHCMPKVCLLQLFSTCSPSFLSALKEDFLNDPLVGEKTDQLGLPQTLQQEFSLINVQIRNVNVEVKSFLFLAC